MAELSEVKAEIKDAEVVEEKGLSKISSSMEALVKDNDKAMFRALADFESLDWKALTPPQMAILLMQRPLPVSGGGTSYLNLRQAMFFAVRANELGLSPFGTSLWFDPNRFAVNVTLEGKRELARIRGIDLGPPSFEELTRDWSEVSKTNETAEDAKKAGFPKDIGIRCKMRVGDVKNAEFSIYTAWLSEWFQPRSPVWKSKPIHMLSVRSNEKAITLALGVGASAMPDERDLD